MPEKKAVRAVARQTKQARPNVVVRFAENVKKLVRETVGELKKVSWPTRQEAFHLTRIVLVVILLFGFYFFFIDTALTLAVEVLLGIG